MGPTQVTCSDISCGNDSNNNTYGNDNNNTTYGNDNSNVGNIITNSNITIHADTNPKQEPGKTKSEVLKWISSLELLDRHNDLREPRIEGVGDWILETPEFKGWEDGSAHPVLFCDGDPGVGKTCISSLIIDTLCSQASKRNFRVFYLYCDYREQLSATELVAGLLKKVVVGLDRTPEKVSQRFEESKKHGCGQRRPLLQDLVDMLGTVLASFERAFICIDALDEFSQNQMPRLLSSLAKLIPLSPKTRLFLTGRPLIRREIKRRFGQGAQIVSIRARVEDIRSYITHRLGQDPNSDVMNPGLEDEIAEILPEKASGIFLLVHLRMDAILEAMSVRDRRARLLEDGLELWSEYSNTLDRINRQDTTRSNLALRVLMWLCYSKRPLCANELSHALAVEKGSKSFNPEGASPTQTLLGCCLGLVAVDKETSTVRFIHSTLKDYLHNKPDLFRGGNPTIAETCLTYLNTQEIKSLPPSLPTAPEESPFLHYASRYWAEHAWKEPEDHTKALAEDLLRLYPGHISAKLLLLEKYWPWQCSLETPPHGFSGLHCTAFLGLQEMATTFLNAGDSSARKKDITGSTPLMWAARNGHGGLVRLFLEQEGIFDLETKDVDGCTSLLWAARNGHRGVVALFLEERTIDLGTEDDFGLTPLTWASGGGHREVVELLLERGSNPRTKDRHGRTPLSWACGGGHRDVVELLLETEEAYLNLTDNEGREPVSWAAEAGNEEVVDLFLHRYSVDPNLLDGNERTLLSRAAESGNCSVVKLLLDQIGIKSSMADKSDTTPLSWAASQGNEAVVELFMKKREIGAGSLDKDGSISLWWAAGSGHAGVVRILLGWEGVDPNFFGGYRQTQTPLVRAAMHGHENVVALFLESKSANHNLTDRSGRTPLSWAAGNWHGKVVELLLNSGRIDTELADKDGRTPLLWASRNGDGRVVQLLLKEGNARPGSRGADGRTPLSWAAGEGHEKVVGLLLGWPDAKPNLADESGRTPLSWAAGNGREAVAKLLLSRDDIEPNVADGAGRTPLAWATKNGREAVIKLLRSRSNLEPDAADFDAQKVSSGPPTHTFGSLLRRLSARSLSHIFHFFLCLIAFWALCL